MSKLMEALYHRTEWHDRCVTSISSKFFFYIYLCKVLQILHRWISDIAAHDAQHAFICHPDTCKTIAGAPLALHELDRRPFSHVQCSVLWFNGPVPVGAGKTSIAQTLCKRYAAAQWLARMLFFLLATSAQLESIDRENAEFLFPRFHSGSPYSPDVGKIIDEVIANDTSMLTKALEIQLQKLILDPLQQVSEQLNLINRLLLL
jgi:hypothetical protein